MKTSNKQTSRRHMHSEKQLTLEGAIAVLKNQYASPIAAEQAISEKLAAGGTLTEAERVFNESPMGSAIRNLLGLGDPRRNERPVDGDPLGDLFEGDEYDGESERAA